MAEKTHPTLGPSTVVRQIDNADMLDATRTLIGTSGFLRRIVLQHFQRPNWCASPVPAGKGRALSKKFRV